MIKKEIVIKKKDGKVQYLTEVLPEIPTNTILYKKLTGLGATYGEIKAKRNSVIFEPNKPVIIGKCKDPKHKDDNLFGVCEGVSADDVENYIIRSIEQDKRFKILTTPESFPKVRKAFESMDIDMRFQCFLLFDECHKIIKDTDYRSSITLPMDFFFECENKALVSATPIEFSDPRFAEQGFQTISIVPNFEYIKDLNLHITNNLLQTAKKVLLEERKESCFMFCNSTDTIYALMKQLNILEESAVFCSDKSVDKLKRWKFQNASDVWDKNMMKHYNWMTSRFYNAVDIELVEKPNIFLLTDCYFTEYTVFDANTDVVQCVGRFRNGVTSIHHISNINRNFQVRSRDELNGYITCSKEVYDMLQNYYEYATTISAKDAYRAALKSLPFTKMLDENGKVNYFAIDNYINDGLVKGCYQCADNLMAAFTKCDMFVPALDEQNFKLGDYERLQRVNKNNSIKEKRRIIVEQLELIGICETELEYSFKRDLINADAFIVEAYEKIGREEIERLNYNRKRIKEAIILADARKVMTGTEVQSLVRNSFEVNHWYSAKHIKAELKRIFKLVGFVPKKAVTSHTILDFFDAVPKQHDKVKGYWLIKSKTI